MGHMQTIETMHTQSRLCIICWLKECSNDITKNQNLFLWNVLVLLIGSMQVHSASMVKYDGMVEFIMLKFSSKTVKNAG